MNGQLSYQLAQAHQQELYRKADHARAARELSRPGRFSALWHKLTSGRSTDPQLQAQPPARRPVARGVGEI